jgi:S-adenosylmethionine decarboxylase
MNHKGKHVLVDFIFNPQDIYDDVSLAHNIMNIMEDAISRTSMRIVHRCLKILGDTPLSEPGFTSVLLLDESHITSHCYSDKGLLAMDLFTCGPTDTQAVMDYIIQRVTALYPSFQCIYNGFHYRFHY